MINNHTRHPLSPHKHLDKLPVLAIVDQIIWSTYKIAFHKMRAHTSMIGNNIANQLANDGTTLAKPTTTLQIHIDHTTPY